MERKLKTIKDIVEQSNNVYKGRFWNRHLKEFQSWKENRDWEERFYSFSCRMWLDNEDENLTLPAAGNRLSKNAYINKYEDYLYIKFIEQENEQEKN